MHQHSPIHLLLPLLTLLFLNSCQTTIIESNQLHNKILRATVSVDFAPDGRLWRLTPTQHAIYIDHSDDNGKTYKKPIRINQADQKISVWPENPAAIKISPSGRINILYYADKSQKSTSFFSYSDDNGKSFSTPILISNQAKTAMHYMDKMLVDNKDNTYLFWHDTRHELHDKKQADGVLSLYYSKKSASDPSQFNNQLLSTGVCSCCRTATAMSKEQTPVLFARMVFDDGIRDHALIRMNQDGSWKKPHRVTNDNWQIEACPEHGPAIAIDNNNRIHLTWFTLGNKRQGIFYRQTDDFGITLSEPMPLGNANHLPSHPDVLALQNRVIIVWKEFDGEQTTLHSKESMDAGKSWINKTIQLKSKSNNSHPKLITNTKDIFLSWASKIQGHQLIKL
ncbi:MAG: hypothetical protein GQ547_04355 [Methylophaga sp.]|nr:hypothetical protein [Methylophaga sp.]